MLMKKSFLNPAQKAERTIKEKYGNIAIKSKTITCPYPIELAIKGNLGYFGFLGKYIVIDQDGNIRFEKSSISPAFDNSKLEKLIDYYLSLIARTYNLNYNNDNKPKIKKRGDIV